VKYSEPEFLDPIPPEMAKRIEEFRDAHENDPIGNVGTQLLYEDDDVRVWEMRLEPGEASDLHHHEHDYVLAISSGDLVAGIPPKGGPMPVFVGIVPPQGNTVRVPKGGTEWALNVGEKPYAEILIELKTI
jgi:mannose-6-phosphate isomerase-like protein (cupin superfamily)